MRHGRHARRLFGCTALSGALLATALSVGAATAAVALAPAARAEDGGDGGEGGGDEGAQKIEKEIRAQMEKVLELMKENEAAILAASKHGGKKPAGVEVEPPPATESATPPKGSAGGDGSKDPGSSGKESGGTGSSGSSGSSGSETHPGGAGVPGGKGEEVRRSMEELIRATQQGGGTIPTELEQLVRLIPIQQSSSPSQGGEGGEPQNAPRKRELSEEDGSSKGKSEPKDGQKNKDKPDGSGRPPSSETGEPPKNADPAWTAQLPEEVRRLYSSGQRDKIPERWQKFIKYMNDHEK